MAKKYGIDISIDIEPKLLNYFNNEMPEKLQEARKNSIHAAGMVWADETKDITTAEDHIDTGLYVNSIGYATGTPSSPLYEMNEGRNESTLIIGADVSYASILEKRYSLMARGLDVSESRMKKVVQTQVKNTLGL